MQKNVKRGIAGVVLAGSAMLALSGCVSSADRASQNLSTEAENFKIPRQITFYNGITDKIMLTVKGYCSVETGDSALSGSLEVTCKDGPGSYKKDYLGLADNVSYVVQQLKDTDVSEYHYEIILKPENIIPNFQIQTEGSADN